MSEDKKNEVVDYADQYDNSFRVKPRIRSLMSRGSRAIAVEEFDPALGEWRTKVKMTRRKMDERTKGAFLEEYAKWGRMGEAAQAAGVSTQTIRKALEDDEDFASALMICEDEYHSKLIGHHQDLVFNGQEKVSYDRNGNVISRETVYPIRLIELELKKHDAGYRDKQEVAVSHSGGVLVAPAEMGTIEAWEKNFTKMVDITPKDEEE